MVFSLNKFIILFVCLIVKYQLADDNFIISFTYAAYNILFFLFRKSVSVSYMKSFY